jgi:hypothetical protein
MSLLGKVIRSVGRLAGVDPDRDFVRDLFINYGLGTGKARYYWVCDDDHRADEMVLNMRHNLLTDMRDQIQALYGSGIGDNELIRRDATNLLKTHYLIELLNSDMFERFKDDVIAANVDKDFKAMDAASIPDLLQRYERALQEIESHKNTLKPRVFDR